MVNCLMSICDLHRIRYAVLLLLLGVAMAGVQAQTVVADPTAPPAGFSASAMESMEVTGPVLQSVKIPKNGKPLALASGLILVFVGVFVIGLIDNKVVATPYAEAAKLRYPIDENLFELVHLLGR